MAFNKQYLGRSSANDNASFAVNYTTLVATPGGSTNLWMYNAGPLAANDTQAAVATAGYFNSQTSLFQVGDLIFVWDNAATGQFYTVTAVVYGNGTNTPSVTIAAFGAVIGVIGTANIANGAVTYAKIQNEAATTLLGNPTGAPAAPSEITLVAPLSFTGTTLRITPNGVGTAQLATNTIQFASVTFTAAQWNAISDVPAQIVAAPAAGIGLIPIMASFDISTFGAAFTGGGVTILQWGNTAAGAGPNSISATVAAAFFTGAAATQMINIIGGFATTVDASIAAEGLFVSNTVANFGGGAGSSVTVNVSYIAIPV